MDHNSSKLMTSSGDLFVRHSRTACNIMITLRSKAVKCASLRTGFTGSLAKDFLIKSVDKNSKKVFELNELKKIIIRIIEIDLFITA
jgi:hypothetical protein